MRFVEGAVVVPRAPGFGVSLDRDSLAAMNADYLRRGRRERDDRGYMRTMHPDFDATLPRW